MDKTTQPTQNLALAQKAVNSGYVKSTDEYFAAENAGRAQANNDNQKSQPKPDLSVINSDLLRPRKDIEVPEVPPPTRDTRIMTDPGVMPPATPTGTVEQKPLTLKEQTEKYLQQQLSGENKIDSSSIREELGVSQKQKTAKDLENKLIATRTRYERQIERLESNPDKGLNSSKLNAQINQLSKEANRELADVSFQYKIANDDYTGAQSVLNERVADLKDQRDYELGIYKLAVDSIRDDLTEKELVEVNFQNRLKEIEFENEISRTVEEGKSSLIEAQAQNYQNLLDEGTIAVKDVPKELMGYINTKGYVSPEQKASLDKSKTLLTKINDFLGTGGTTAVGPGIQRILGATAGFFGFGNYEQRKKQVETIQSLLTLDNLKLMTGVLTDRDIQLLQSAASSLSPSMKESDYRKELATISSSISDKLISSPAVPFEQKVEILTTKLKREYPKATEEEISDLIDEQLPEEVSFNSSGNASVSSLANAIKTVESGGNYKARGPVVTSGQYKGERALGAYQIMPGNLPSWSKEALGYEVSEQEFLQNPQIQDVIAQSRFTNLLKTYSPEDASAIWFSGRPLARNNSKDVTGTNVRTYVDRVIKNLS